MLQWGPQTLLPAMGLLLVLVCGGFALSFLSVFNRGTWLLGMVLVGSADWCLAATVGSFVPSQAEKTACYLAVYPGVAAVALGHLAVCPNLPCNPSASFQSEELGCS